MFFNSIKKIRSKTLTKTLILLNFLASAQANDLRDKDCLDTDTPPPLHCSQYTDEHSHTEEALLFSFLAIVAICAIAHMNNSCSLADDLQATEERQDNENETTSPEGEEEATLFAPQLIV